MGATNKHFEEESELSPVVGSQNQLQKAAQSSFNEPQDEPIGVDFKSEDFHDNFSTRLKHAPNFNLPSDDASDSLTVKGVNLSRGRWLAQFHGAWRTTVTAGMLAALVVFLVNLGVFIWLSVSKTGIRNGSTTAYEGSCADIRRISTWCHLAINIFSTLLLGASNNAMQCLVSPTRAEVNRAHSKGAWLDIGIPTTKNSKFLARRRVILWACLCITSVPLHLLYNSVIYSSLSATDYLAVRAGYQFLDGEVWNTDPPLDPSATDILQDIIPGHGLSAHALAGQISSLQLQARSQSHTLSRLESAACNKTYSPALLSSWRNVLIVSKSFDYPNSSLAASISVHPTKYSGEYSLNSTPDVFTTELPIYREGEAQWTDTCPQQALCLGIGPLLCPDEDIDYCLAENAESHCKLYFNTSLLLVVLLCNAIKCFCLFWTLSMSRFHPFITIGDAVASFMNSPEELTANHGALTYDDFQRMESIESLFPGSEFSIRAMHLRPWNPRQYRWLQGKTGSYWDVGLIFIVLLWLAIFLCLSLLLSGKQWPSLSALWTLGFGTVQIDYVIPTAMELSTLANVLIVNTPQLCLSFVYFFVNGLLTSMLLSIEYSDYATARKGLRVSNPEGHQRSTYYLQLPYRYAVTLIALSALLHWLFSQSIFLVLITEYDIFGNVLPQSTHGDLTRYGCSGIALVFTVILSGLMIVILLVICARKHHPKMPIVASCSFAISAACHPPINDDDGALGRLRYGITGVNDDGTRHVSFSSGEVSPLVPGELYK